MSNFKRCPYCGSFIPIEAIRCKNCREWLTEDGEKPCNYLDTVYPNNETRNVSPYMNKGFSDYMVDTNGETVNHVIKEKKQQFRTNRKMWKFFLFSLLTLGIYGIVVMSHISTEINHIATKYDHRHTIHFCLSHFLFSWLTLFIYPLIWYSNLCSRIGDELFRRNINYSFGPGYYWGWAVFGFFILVGPFIFGHKLFKAMNLLCMDYNTKGY